MTGWSADDWDPGRDGPKAGDDGPCGLDDALVDRLLEATDAESVPARYRPLADVLVAARAPATRAELAGETEAVARFTASRTTPTTVAWSFSRRTCRSTKALVVAATLTFVTATGVAAATGSLPDDVQDMASEVLTKFGINVPGSRRDTPPANPERTDVGRPEFSTPTASSTNDEAGPGETVSGLVAEASAARIRSSLVVLPAPPDPLGDAAAETPAAIQEEPPPADPLQTSAAEPEPASIDTPTSAPTDPSATVPAAAQPPTPNGPPSTVPATPPPPAPNGPPSGEPSDRPPSAANGPPSWAPAGPPPGVPAGPPESVPAGPPPHAPAGPPESVPSGPPPHAPAGPPASIPAGPPPSVPAGPPPYAPAGPPPSLPVDPPGRAG